MRRNINCHGAVLEDLCYDRDWYKIVKQRNHVCIPELNPLKVDNYIKDTPDNIWEILDRDGVHVHDMDALARAVSSDRGKVISRPNDIYIYDDDAERAESLSSRYGTLIIPSRDLDMSSLTEAWQLIPKNGAILSWSDFFKPYHIKPSPVSNSLILIDRYLFAYNSAYKLNYMNGVRNLLEILYEILPSDYDGEYHVLVIFDENTISKGANFDSVADALKEMLKLLCRRYKIMVELLSIPNKDSGDIFSETHDRRIISSYYRITTSYTFAAFANSNPERLTLPSRSETYKAVRSQTIRMEPIYDGINCRRQNLSSLPIKGCDDTLDLLASSLKHMKKNKQEYRYINVTTGCKDISKIKNRLIENR